MALPLMAREKFTQSAVNEYTGWMTWSGILPLSQKEADAVWADPVLRRRVMKSRAAYKNKSKAPGIIQAKTRVVLIVCNDPDLTRLTRDSPTPTRLSEFVILAIAASGANRAFQEDGLQWHLWLSDAEKAFLQGVQDKTERGNQPPNMAPPRDPTLEAANAYPAPLYEIVGNCYGLANAPRVWSVPCAGLDSRSTPLR